jgi:hypothetical protein
MMSGMPLLSQSPIGRTDAPKNDAVVTAKAPLCRKHGCEFEGSKTMLDGQLAE